MGIATRKVVNQIWLFFSTLFIQKGKWRTRKWVMQPSVTLLIHIRVFEVQTTERKLASWEWRRSFKTGLPLGQSAGADPSEL